MGPDPKVRRLIYANFPRMMQLPICFGEDKAGADCGVCAIRQGATVAQMVNTVLQELGCKGHANAALQVFQWMQLQGWCRLDPHLYTIVIDTLGSAWCLDLAERCSSI